MKTPLDIEMALNKVLNLLALESWIKYMPSLLR